jgi:hypothetical protein
MTGGGDPLPFVAVGVGVWVTGRVPLGARVSVSCAGKVRETGCVGVSLEAAVGVAVLVGRARNVSSKCGSAVSTSSGPGDLGIPVPDRYTRPPSLDESIRIISPALSSLVAA